MNEKIEAIQSSGYFANIVITGGGTGAINKIMSHAGASRFVNEIIVPYSQKSMEQYLGEPLNSGCSEAAAVTIADKAFCTLSINTALGISCTAALRTTRERRGKDRAHICIIDKFGCKTIEVNFRATSREYQEMVLTEAIINAIFEFVEMRKAIKSIFNGTLPFTFKLNGSDKGVECVQDLIILPGSFNPLHDGHKKLMAIAERISGKTGLYEISLTNADKGECEDIDTRLKQFDNENFIITNAKFFVDKAKLFPGAWFVIGYDTAIRILDPKYSDVNNAINTFRELGTKFLVGGRYHKDKFYTIDEAYLALNYRDIFIPISEEEFREDISSTEIRKEKLNESR